MSVPDDFTVKAPVVNGQETPIRRVRCVAGIVEEAETDAAGGIRWVQTTDPVTCRIAWTEVLAALYRRTARLRLFGEAARIVADYPRVAEHERALGAEIVAVRDAADRERKMLAATNASNLASMRDQYTRDADRLRADLDTVKRVRDAIGDDYDRVKRELDLLRASVAIDATRRHRAAKRKKARRG